LARTQLVRLEESVKEEMDQKMDQDDLVLDMVPTSGKYSQNLRSVVRNSRTDE
jgi:hypothetical protein